MQPKERERKRERERRGKQTKFHTEIHANEITRQQQRRRRCAKLSRAGSSSLALSKSYSALVTLPRVRVPFRRKQIGLCSSPQALEGLSAGSRFTRVT